MSFEIVFFAMAKMIRNADFNVNLDCSCNRGWVCV